MNILRKKTTATLLIAIFMISIFVVAIPIASAAAPVTYYVDDSATGANDGTSWTDAYTTISDALLVAQPSDTILVESGVYTEDVIIATSYLTLESKDPYGANIKGKVLIGGVGVSVSGVSVIGFKITDFTALTGAYAGIWLRGVEVKDILIDGNLIDGSAVWPANKASGIETVKGTGTGSAKIVNNEIRNVRLGIYANPEFPLEITGNTITAVKCIGTENSPVVANYNNFIVLYDDLKDMAGLGVEAFGVSVDAQFNYWGEDPMDIPNMISGSVDYDPWLSAPYPGGVPVSMGDIVLTGKARYPMVSIDITLFDGAFGDVITGIPTKYFRLRITNTGEIRVDVTAEVIDDTDSFYTEYLKIADETGMDYANPADEMIQDLPGAGYKDPPGGSKDISLRLEVPLTAVEPGTYKGTLFFIAEADCEITP